MAAYFRPGVLELEPEVQSTTPAPSAAECQRPSHPASRKRVWKRIPFQDCTHEYPSLPVSSVRTPMEYFSDYFDKVFFEEVSRCTNLYYLRKTGRELKTTAVDIAKVFSIHIIIGSIHYPRVPMYWRTGLKLDIISKQMARDQFLTIRNALHVVDTDEAPPNERTNPLWKVQPMIDKVKIACNKLERVPGFYSIDEQMIPFTGRCILRQVVRNKPRPVGLKNFVLTTSEGLMLDFDIYQGAKTMFGDTSLGLGPSVILHLIKSVPPGSCIYHDRYFTTVPLIEEMHKRKLHSTGTIMLNRIPDRAAIKFKSDSKMARGENQQYVSKPTVIVKWKDNKSVLMASNCTGSSMTSIVKRWDKRTKTYVDVSVPKVIERYNQHMGGVDVLIHFLDLAIVNSWRLYRNDCQANKLSRKDILPLLDFRLNIADGLSSIPPKERLLTSDTENIAPAAENGPPIKRHYRPANKPSEAKRYDGYDHFPVFDEIKAPRMCRYENCCSRTKIR
ncbi:hypothetical protein K1T71_000268 [Dendrolimus kikuchii]|uniref:Uncharacterized protein n=1 Tax=Dendrolimus kikuchii TaxID=765133 RepID=A0ACC1DJ02_9NEOP|nr:hypothetical protein K1T71_000268 [Dendrolimus kikuchii]